MDQEIRVLRRRSRMFERRYIKSKLSSERQTCQSIAEALADDVNTHWVDKNTSNKSSPSAQELSDYVTEVDTVRRATGGNAPTSFIPPSPTTFD